MLRTLLALLPLTILLGFLPAEAADKAAPVHAIAMHGDPKYPASFKHFDYVNPDAPKGGRLRLSALETFDSFNPYIIKGVAAEGLGLTSMTLTEQSTDEHFTAYGALAETMEMPADRSEIIFNIRPSAIWSDDVPVSADDVKFSFSTLMKDAAPYYRAYYADVVSVDVLGPKRVRFAFRKGTANLELPLIVGQMPILPKHYWTEKDRKFAETTLEPPVGNGPYRIAKFEPGRSIAYQRVKGWWGEKLPAFKGRYNFDTITYDYYRDRNVELEAFFANAYDYRQEMTAKLWATSYTAPAVKDGRIVKTEIPNKLPQGMQGFLYNTRRPVFADQAVRKALDYAFDFEWSNKQFAYGSYVRTNSYFANSDMAAPLTPPSGRVLEILTGFKDQLPPDVFTTRYVPPKSDGSGNNRANLRMAMKILDDAGWKIGKDGLRANAKGTRLEFEFLTNGGNAAFDRWIAPFIQTLSRMGVKANFRVVDASQFVNRVNQFDFDMIVGSIPQSLSPGNEQREFWMSDRADMDGSRNYIGIKSPVVDRLVEMVIAAPDEKELIARAQTLDYVLLSGNYVIPNWHLPAWRIAYWDKFDRPQTQAPYSLGVADTWWAKPSAAKPAPAAKK